MVLEQFMKDYFEDSDEFYKSIEMFEKKRKLKLFKKLESDKDEINFYSWLTEMRLGLFFDQFCDDIKYDQSIENKTPDWTITINNQNILAEVLRINNMPEIELRKKIKRIQEIRNRNKEHGSVKYLLGTEPKDMSSQYFYGAQDKLEQKEKNYRNIVRKHAIPLILCPAPILDSYIGALDTFDFLIGNSKSGFFYTNDNFGKHVTGVLLRRIKPLALPGDAAADRRSHEVWLGYPMLCMGLFIYILTSVNMFIFTMNLQRIN